MTSLHEELLADKPRQTQCLVCLFIESLPLADQEEWKTEFALPPKVVSTAALRRAMSRRGTVIGRTSISLHRRKHVAP
jgi:hypothetical protein